MTLVKLFTSTFAVLFVAANAAIAGGLAPSANQPIVQNPVAATVAPVLPPDWSGLYFGLHAGQGDLKNHVNGDLVAEYETSSTGLHVGYLHDFGQFVLGAEAEFSRTYRDGIDRDESDPLTAKYQLIAGYDAGRILPYVALGTVNYSDSVIDMDETGSAYAVGVDYKVTDSFTVGARYSVEEFTDVDVGVDGYDIEFSTLSLRASYRF